MNKTVKFTALLDLLFQWGKTINEVNKLQQARVSESDKSHVESKEV